MVDLARYDNRRYDAQRPFWLQAAWFFVGLPLLRCPVLPGSALRRSLLRAFGATIGDGVVIKPGTRVKYPWLLSVGDHSWLGEDCWLDNLSPITVGHDACISQGAYLCTGNHNWSDIRFLLITKPIAISDGAWVGARAIVAPGVTLGESAILTAGSVAKKDIPPHHIYDGNPARLTRVRQFSNAPEARMEPAGVGSRR